MTGAPADQPTHAAGAAARRVRAHVGEVLGRAGDTLPFARALPLAVSAWTAYLDADPDARRALHAAHFELDPAARAAQRATIDRHYRALLAPLVRGARERGELRADLDAEDLLALLVEVCPHLALAPFAAGTVLDPRTVSRPVDGLLATLVRAFAAGGDGDG